MLISATAWARPREPHIRPLGRLAHPDALMT